MTISYKHRLSITTLIITLFLLTTTIPAQELPVAGVQDIKRILPVRQRAEVQNQWLKWRLENILPQLMRREGIDLWLVINREYNEDPVYLTLVPKPIMNARRTTILMFHDQGAEKGIQRLSGSYYGMGHWYKGTWKNKNIKQFESLAQVIKKLKPKRIGINVSAKWAFGDGLSASLEKKLRTALGRKLSSRLVSAENICIGWLETRSPRELSVYRHICGIAHDLIAEFFSNRTITPGITTTQQVVWWIRQRINSLGLTTWFQPSISIQRWKKAAGKFPKGDRVIRRGDLLHCDVGIVYLGLCTDMQWQAYVCRIGETDAPMGLKKALANANKLAAIFMNEFKLGRSGNAIVKSAMRKGKEDGLRPLIYSHPIGFHGHGAGPPMEARPVDKAPEGFQLRGEYPLYPDTVYAIEFSVFANIPEWDGQEVRIGFEENGVFTDGSCHFVDGHQKQFLLIR